MSANHVWTKDEREAIEAAQRSMRSVIESLEELAWKTYVRVWDKNPFPKMCLFRLWKGKD